MLPFQVLLAGKQLWITRVLDDGCGLSPGQELLAHHVGRQALPMPPGSKPTPRGRVIAQATGSIRMLR